MRILHAVTAMCLLQTAAATAALAAVDGLEINPRVGTGTLHIDSEAMLNGRAKNVDTVGAGVTLSYTTPIGLLAEGGYSSHGNWDFFGAADEYKFSEYMIALGYRFETRHDFRLIPKVGRNQWKLYNKEGAFDNPGPEDEKTLKSYDYFWEFTLQKQVSDAVALGVTYKKNHFDFGSLRSIAFTMSFAL